MLSATSSLPGVSRFVCVCAIVSAILVPGFAGNSDAKEKIARPTSGVRTPQPTYEVSVGLDGEIYPVFANYASLKDPRQRNWGTVAVRVTNSTADPLRN